MGRNDNTWSDRHKAAIGYAQAELGMSSSEATAAGKRGELGLPSFDMPDPTARQYAQEYRRGDIEPPEPVQDAEANARRLQAEVNKQVGELLADPKPPHWKVKQVADMQAAVSSAAHRVKPRRTPKTKDPDNGDQDPRSLLTTLLQPTTPAQAESDAGSG